MEIRFTSDALQQLSNLVSELYEFAGLLLWPTLRLTPQDHIG